MLLYIRNNKRPSGSVFLPAVWKADKCRLDMYSVSGCAAHKGRAQRAKAACCLLFAIDTLLMGWVLLTRWAYCYSGPVQHTGLRVSTIEYVSPSNMVYKSQPVRYVWLCYCELSSII